jgi:hypothetical protein
MNQQRSRRFRTAKDASEVRERAEQQGEKLSDERAFDSNRTFPGASYLPAPPLQSFNEPCIRLGTAKLSMEVCGATTLPTRSLFELFKYWVLASIGAQTRAMGTVSGACAYHYTPRMFSLTRRHRKRDGGPQVGQRQPDIRHLHRDHAGRPLSGAGRP